MLELIKYETDAGVFYRPVADIWKIKVLDDGQYRVTFHRAMGDFDEVTLSPDEMRCILDYKDAFNVED